jgi:hypothetical protein
MRLTITAKDEFEMLRRVGEALCAMVRKHDRTTIRTVVENEVSYRQQVARRATGSSLHGLETVVSDADQGL